MTPTRNEPVKTPALASTDMKNEPAPKSDSERDVKNRYRIMDTASFKADSPNINIYSRLSTFEGKSESTVTGSVEEMIEPKTRDEINESFPSIAVLKPYISSDVTKVE